ncbi:MAG: hypothetical protein HY778_01940 [Betaproteobacteria bacterium]|nr:hypothetical protein [Betaproteobacteria bacterium]
MTNLTIAVDEQVLRDARMRALQEGTSVNALLRSYLENYAGQDQKCQRATRRMLELAQDSTAASDGRRWSRDELHER